MGLGFTQTSGDWSKHFDPTMTFVFGHTQHTASRDVHFDRSGLSGEGFSRPGGSIGYQQYHQTSHVVTGASREFSSGAEYICCNGFDPCVYNVDKSRSWNFWDFLSYAWDVAETALAVIIGIAV